MVGRIYHVGLIVSDLGGMDHGYHRFCIAFHFRDELPAHHRG